MTSLAYLLLQVPAQASAIEPAQGEELEAAVAHAERWGSLALTLTLSLTLTLWEGWCARYA